MEKNLSIQLQDEAVRQKDKLDQQNVSSLRQIDLTIHFKGSKDTQKGESLEQKDESEEQKDEVDRQNAPTV